MKYDLMVGSVYPEMKAQDFIGKEITIWHESPYISIAHDFVIEPLGEKRQG